MIKQEKFDISEIKTNLDRRGIVFDSNAIYILPAQTNDDTDILNEYTPDIYKILKKNGIEAIIVKSAQYKYLGLRDASIILPLIFGIPFAVLANFITEWIKKCFKPNDHIRLQYIAKDGDSYKKITIECNQDELESIIRELKGM